MAAQINSSTRDELRTMSFPTYKVYGAPPPSTDHLHPLGCSFVRARVSSRLQEKGNLALLGALMVVAAVVVARTDFDTLEEAFGVAA